VPTLTAITAASAPAFPKALGAGPASPLCASGEETFFRCVLKGRAKEAALCGSKDLSKSSGWLSFRFGSPGAIEVEYPGSQVHPSKAFHWSTEPVGPRAAGDRPFLWFKRARSTFKIDGPIEVTWEDTSTGVGEWQGREVLRGGQCAVSTYKWADGLRVGELLALKWQDIDLVAAHLIVRRTLWRDQEGPPKGGQNRKVPLSDEALATLKAHRHLRGPYVFCLPPGARLTHSMVKDVVPDTCRRAGLGKRLTTHGLRHTFASHLVMRGASLKAVQELLGHESIEMTLRYSHLTPDVKREAVRLLDRTELPGDIQETEGAEKENPRGHRGLDGAGKGI
jgi:Phage integrase family